MLWDAVLAQHLAYFRFPHFPSPYNTPSSLPLQFAIWQKLL